MNEQKKRLVLGIESSCDETGVALVQSLGSGVPALLAHALHSQIEMHQAYGGVVPELASRDHIRRVLPLTRAVLAEAGRSLDEVDVVAYTRGPGLAGALLVGAIGVGVALALPTRGCGTACGESWCSLSRKMAPIRTPASSTRNVFSSLRRKKFIV